MGHDEKYCRAYQLMREKMVDAYLMKTEEQVKILQAALLIAWADPGLL